MAAQSRAVGIGRALVVAQLHAEPERDALLEYEVAAAAILARACRGILRQAQVERDVVARSGAV